MSIPLVGPAAVDHPDVSLQEDIDAIKQTAADAVSTAASNTDTLNHQAPTIRKINGIPLTGDVYLTDTVLNIYKKKVIDDKIGAVGDTSYNPVYLNGHLLDRDVNLTAGDVGSYDNPQITTKKAGLVPTTRKVNNKALTGNITLGAADVNVYTKAEIDLKTTGVLPTRKVNNIPLAGNIVLTPADVGAPATADVVLRTFKINGQALTGTGITLSSASGSYTKAQFDALLPSYIPIVNTWGLGMRAVPLATGNGFFSYTTGGPAGSTAGYMITAGKGALAFPSDRSGVYYRKDSGAFQEVKGSSGVKAAPMPHLWAPLKDSLTLITGEGPWDTVTINGQSADLTTRSVQFSRASTATYIDKSGVFRTAAMDEPRFEADGLLIECQSTNLFPNSVATTWQANGGGGVDDGDGFVRVTGSTPTKGIFSNITGSYTAGKTYTFSCWLNVIKGAVRIGFEVIPNGLQVFTPADTPGLTRVTITVTPATTITSALIIYIGGAGDTEFTVGRCQVENLGVATSYIPTAGTAVTRAADTAWVPETGNIPPGTDMSISCKLGSWYSTQAGPVILQGLRFGYLYQSGTLVISKSYGNTEVAFNGTTKAAGTLALSIDTHAKTHTLVINGELKSTPYPQGTTLPLSDKLYLSAPTVGQTHVAANNVIEIMHMSDVKIWMVALEDAQMRGL